MGLERAAVVQEGCGYCWLKGRVHETAVSTVLKIRGQCVSLAAADASGVVGAAAEAADVLW